MDYRSTRIIQVVLIVAVIVVIVLVLLPILRGIFANQPTSNTITQDQRTLVNTSAGRSVMMSVRGNIVAEENFRSYEIEISPNSRRLTTYKGYTETVIRNVTLNNNVAAYEQFVYALNRAGFMDGLELTGVSNDTRGVCADGLLYKFQMLDSNDASKMLWTTTCSQSRGSFRESLSDTRELFIEQIPDAESVIPDL